MRVRRVAVILPGIVALGVAGCSFAGQAASARRADLPPANVSAGAETYYRHLVGCLDRLAADLPAVTASAQTAAAKFVATGGRLRQIGGGAEFQGRSGGLFAFGGRGRVRDDQIVLAFLSPDAADEQIAEAKQAAAAGAMVVCFGDETLLARARDAGINTSLAVNTHTGAEELLLREPGGRWGVPSYRAAHAAAGWVWTAEFVAACTRQGKMPTLWRAFAVPEGRAWAQRIEKRQQDHPAPFHAQTPPQIPAGQLGKAYLTELRRTLETVHREEMGDIRAAAALATAAQQGGRHVYTYVSSHTTSDIDAPGCFTRINGQWKGVKSGIRIDPGDFILVVEYDGIVAPAIIENGNSLDTDFAAQARKAGATIAWSFTTYRGEHRAGVAPDELLIDQHWDFGDAAVEVPGYPFKAFPISGVICEAVLWMVNAEVCGAGAEGRAVACRGGYCTVNSGSANP